MGDMCYNLITVNIAFDIFVKKLDESGVHELIYYFCILYKEKKIKIKLERFENDLSMQSGLVSLGCQAWSQ